MTLAIILLIVAILLVLLVNESGVDPATGRILRILIIGGALLFLVIKVLPGV